jgi:16S rRNA U516 pseudouridylate synthase RsuA-like enzyme
MIRYIDLNLIHLHREKIGNLSIDVEMGDWRLLNDKDMKKIFEKLEVD